MPKNAILDGMHKPNVLFLCTGNSARSQMGEALLRKHAGDRFNVYSAGTDPKGVNPLTIKALEEIGLPTNELRSKGVKEYLGKLRSATSSSFAARRKSPARRFGRV